ncbi:hypothetical protein [Crocosphaera sp. XPORK-15E]|uniref:P-loop NTPase n=1 Tax=Crocosphaera sp. XPORK-15E TaxID=3110247 RepID=UPI002B22132A|nr:hypothetical protein [Crocosphaera sp. XPORK-15E]MEA5535989.1 hypothetical protein [Crocosphaera sp. XPORK-15E]
MLSFFNGRSPEWADILAQKSTSDRSFVIPQREIVDQLVNLLEGAKYNSKPSVTFLRGATGEGKRTAILQTVCQLGRQKAWYILWCNNPREEIDWFDFIQDLPQSNDKPWLIVISQAELMIINILTAITRHRNRKDIKFLLCCLNLDWQFIRKKREWKTEWRQYIYGEEELRGLSPKDAEQIVTVWGEYGQEGLKELFKVTTVQERANKLLDAAKGEAAYSHEGTFFGAILEVRWGEEGLKKHLEEDLLIKLQENYINREKNLTLQDAFTYISVIHGVKEDILYKDILAQVLKLEENQLEKIVIEPLAEEALATRASAERILTRHYKIAMAVQEILFKNCPDSEFEKPYIDLVETAMSMIDKDRNDNEKEKFKKWGYLSKRIFNQGKKEEDSRKENLGCHLAHSVFNIIKNKQFLVTLSSLYRKLKDPEKSVELFRNEADNISGKDRQFYNEWATAEGECRKWSLDIYLNYISLADEILGKLEGELDEQRVSAAFSGLSVAFTELYESREKEPSYLQKSCWTICHLGIRKEGLVDNKAKKHLRDYKSKAEKNKNLEFDKNDEDYFEEFLRGLELIYEREKREVNDLPFWVPSYEELKFESLKEYLRIQSTSQSSSPKPIKRPSLRWRR